ncbi:hypothetical protein GCM10022207_88230 [Streptomyces lannensis]|uniref:Lipoprotein n=1 Tax=Streptomyces lannensis TaxID=766498 RepID=A0ABP7LPQ3_9ACTN
MSRASTQLAGVVLTIAVFAAACSFPDSGGRGPVTYDPRPLSAALVTSAADTIRLQEREESAVAACMVRRGLRYLPQRAVTSERAVTTNPYGLLREEQARQDGYGAVGEIISGIGNRAPAATHHSGGWTKALEGTHEEKLTLPTGMVLTYRPDGCAYQGREEAYGRGWNRLENELEGWQALVMDRVEMNGLYANALSAWSACMRESGYSYADLQAPRQELAHRIEATGGQGKALRALGRKELRIAADDYACERKARLHEAVYEAQRDIEHTVLNAAARADIRRYQKFKRTALARGTGSVTSSAPF